MPNKSLSPTTNATNEEKLEALFNEQKLRNAQRRKDASTFSTFAISDASQDLGRFAAVNKSHVVGATPSPPDYASPNWSPDPTGVEPPLGLDVNALEPVGTEPEILASLGALAPSDAGPEQPIGTTGSGSAPSPLIEPNAAAATHASHSLDANAASATGEAALVTPGVAAKGQAIPMHERAVSPNPSPKTNPDVFQPASRTRRKLR